MFKKLKICSQLLLFLIIAKRFKNKPNRRVFFMEIDEVRLKKKITKFSPIYRIHVYNMYFPIYNSRIFIFIFK